MPRVYLGLGSNIEPEKNLQLGVRELRWRFGDLDLSPVYRSAPVGFEGPDFLNLVAGLNTAEAPDAIQWQAELIHDIVGRERQSDRFGSRPLDIDLLLYGDQVADEPALKLPRADVLDYSFVLRPLAELAPDLVHPVTGRTVAEHWRDFDASRHPLHAVSVIL